ncbi:MAG: hypothetical protein R3185_05385 [Candidatus Thermoplasmatota archaeon]|nr:hypothetical protein [Candidatus Thermoplasmatota archaeon]
MSDHTLLFLTAIRLVGALLALVLVILAARAWRNSKDPRMLRLTLGFSLVLLSIVVEGLSFQLLVPGDLLSAHIIEASFQLSAMAVFIWALF